MTISEAPDARAVFVDKDGTLVYATLHDADPDRVELLPRVGDGLRLLQDAGYLLVIVSNEPGVATGRFPAGALTRVEARIDELLAPYGVIVTSYGWCTHHPAGARVVGAVACACRKPRPGLLLEAAATQGIALDQSWMIGDMLDDVEAGIRAGCRTVLVDRGAETRWRAGRLRTPSAIVYDFTDAAAFIIDGQRRTRVSRPA
jgi:histidinol-phosphate phosphatase family domain/HAD-superfamily hydrolase, subfamily IIIA